MANSKELFLDFRNKLVFTNGKDEAEAIAYSVFDSVLSLSRADIMMNQPVSLTGEMTMRLAAIAARLNRDEPVQYILGEAWFLNRKFTVSPDVLIPRPETEELVMMIAEEYRNAEITLLDIGTGSGCIPVSIKLECPRALVKSADISTTALAVARKNAAMLQADVVFIHLDILTEKIPPESLDVVVSNPPYVLERESEILHKRVTGFEPHLALFTPDDDPLKFYRAIAVKCFPVLVPDGKIFVEINQQFGKEVANLFSETGFVNVEIRKDMAGNDRFVTGKKN